MSSMPIIQFLERFLNVTSDRQSLVINNMANIDTPGYRTRDVDFRAELEHAVGSPEQASMAPVEAWRRLPTKWRDCCSVPMETT